jgi:hypothetical protein
MWPLGIWACLREDDLRLLLQQARPCLPRLEAFEAGLAAVRERQPGESILSAFTRFALGAQGLLGDEQASRHLRAVSEMIVASETLLAHEEHVFARTPTRSRRSSPTRQAPVTATSSPLSSLAP